jgi:general stress protein YciG
MNKPKATLAYKVTREKALAPRIDYDSMAPEIAAVIRQANQAAGEEWMAGIQAYLRSIGRKGGKVGGKASTPAKRRAARANGKLGGRPRKNAVKSRS